MSLLERESTNGAGMTEGATISGQICSLVKDGQRCRRRRERTWESRNSGSKGLPILRHLHHKLRGRILPSNCA